ncbi:hypothetical protein [Staphylococcus arlettae]|uniref:hypothetical protein n=1 Tax=Staphylococcus arlettae TaxID=29378 RepID=UPI0011A63BC7|nr:hypothetical protein [Staphylococcus arlettae]
MKDKQYKDAWQKIKAEMLESYANYEGQKRINKNMGFHKILEGAQISLAPVLEDMDKLDNTNEFNNLLNDLEDE